MKLNHPPSLVAGWLPAWLPDETLYSWCARYHQASGNALAGTTCAQLFGHTRRGYAHDFPVGIDALVERTGGAVGDAETLIRERTLLPFYLPWRSSPSQRHAVKALRMSLPGSLKYRLGLLTSRFGAHHPLRACDDCRAEDTRLVGTPCWHRVHQCPGVYVCPRHATVLRTARVKANGVGRFLFFLPEDRYLAPTPRFDAATRAALTKLAHCAAKVADLAPGTILEPARLVKTYVARARAMGYARGHHGVAQNSIARAYAEATAPLARMDDLAPALGSTEDMGERVARLFRTPRGRTHPLRHLILIACLFPDWDSFLRAYRADAPTSPNEPTRRRDGAARSGIRERFLSELTQRGASLTAAAGKVGIAVATAQDWATRAGVFVPIRPKRLRPELRRRVVAGLKRGRGQAVIAKTLHIAPSLVRAVLRTEVGLRDRWHEAQLRSRREHWRHALRALRMRHPNWRRKELRRRFQAGYAWLRRHDRAWFERALPEPSAKSPTNNCRIDWQRRDRTLRDAVLAWGSSAGGSGRRQRFLPWQVCQAVPALRTQRRNLNRLPLTRAALSRVCARR